MNITKETFKIFARHAKRYSLAVFVIVFVLAVANIADQINSIFYKQLVDNLAAGLDVGAVYTTLGFIAVASIVHHIGYRIGLYVNSYFQTSMMRDLDTSSFVYLHRHSPTFFNNNFVGSLVKRVNRFSSAFEVIADMITFEVLPLTVNVVFILFVLGSRNPYFSIMIIAWLVVFCSINYAFSMYKLKHDIEVSKMESKVTGLLADTITNHQTVKLFNGYEREVASFTKESYELNTFRRWIWNLSNHFEVVQGFLMIGLELGILWFAIHLWSQGRVTVGDFVLIQSYLMVIFQGFWNFGRLFRRYYEQIARANEMTEVFLQPHEIVESINAKDLVVREGEIHFEKVSFAYNQTRRIFHELEFTIAPHQKVALVGPSGAGKSTIVKLLLRNHDVTRGKVRIDGQPINRVTLESLWQSIAYVPQEPILFHRTLMENIRYGRPDATDAEVVAAAKAAHADEFIRVLEKGYDTFVGERGVKLSGGERQRVAIARAILKNAPILILDEATSSLDSESEQYIQDGLDTLMKNKTVIVVAHRLSTIMKMDRILVIEGGQIIEDGTHKKLLAKSDGRYKQLWDIQAGEFVS